MKILDYEYKGSGWEFHRVRFQKINLIVGDSGTGKTRLLNTIFNLGTYVARGTLGGEGEWTLSLEIDEDMYRWNISKVKTDDHNRLVDSEDNESDSRVIVEKEQLFLNEDLILERDNSRFVFLDQSLPKLSATQVSLSLLKEEELIKPLYDGFSKMLRRRFFGDTLKESSRILAVSQKFLDRIGRKKDLFELYKADFALNLRLYVLSRYFPAIYNEIIAYYTEAFDFITDVRIQDSSNLDSLDAPGGTPIFCIKEKSVNRWLRLDELSSGMQKVLLILTDLLSLPEGCIYLIDEYENSLGIGAIDFLPNLLFSKDFDLQILITSHHPYIISNFPVEYWYVTHRRGSQVQFAHGEELIRRYSISSQEKLSCLSRIPMLSIRNCQRTTMR